MQAALRIRRARREDFARVQTLRGSAGTGTRADRKRFRRLVSTMREDLYLAEHADDGSLAGLAVIAYLRGLGPQTAIVRDLCGDADARTLLLAEARARAAARGCTRLEVHLADREPSVFGIADDAAWSAGPHGFTTEVPR